MQLPIFYEAILLNAQSIEIVTCSIFSQTLTFPRQKLLEFYCYNEALSSDAVASSI